MQIYTIYLFITIKSHKNINNNDLNHAEWSKIKQD